MKTDLDHLPANKQRELERVKAIVFEEFEDAIALATMGWKKKGRIEKLILYGSYARGGWVDEPHTAKGYRSDVARLLRDKPEGVEGIAVPGMPRGSPGMEMADGSADAFEVMAFDREGRVSVFSA